MNTMRCAIYARYSSDLQSDRSIDDQIRNCNRFALSKGWTVLDGHIYTDYAISGTSTVGRTGLHQLLSSANDRPCPYGYVLIDDTSRLSRDKIDQAQIIRDLKDAGIMIYFVSDNIDTADETSEDVLLPIYGIKDSLYSRELSRKTKRGMEGQVLRGYSPGGRTYGYHYVAEPDPAGGIDKKTRQPRALGIKIEIDEEQAAVVRTIFSMYASGYGLKGIAHSLNEQDVPSPRPSGRLSGWCPNAIREMLRNRKYIGDWTWNKTKWTRKRKTGKRVQAPRPKSEWVEYENPALLIVGRDKWDAVQERIERRKTGLRGKRVGPRRNYLLSGILKCGVCGSSLVVVKTGKDGDYWYRCNANWQRGAKVCPNNVRVSGKEIEDRVIGALRNQLLAPEVIDLIVEKTNMILREHMGEREGDIRRLSDKRAQAQKELSNLIQCISSGDYTPKSILEAIRKHEELLDQLGADITQLERNSQVESLSVDKDQVKDWLANLTDLVNTDVAGARREIDKLITELSATPSPDRKTITFLGTPSVEGVLGVISGVSNLHGSGDPLFAKLEGLIVPLLVVVRAA